MTLKKKDLLKMCIEFKHLPPTLSCTATLINHDAFITSSTLEEFGHPHTGLYSISIFLL